MRRRERDGCGTFRFFEVSSRGATAQHTPPRQCREEGRKYSFRRRDTVDAWTRRIANGENFFFEKTPLESKTQMATNAATSRVLVDASHRRTAGF